MMFFTRLDILRPVPGRFSVLPGLMSRSVTAKIPAGISSGGDREIHFPD